MWDLINLFISSSDMRKIFIELAVVGLPLLLILMGVNYFVDPAHKFDDNYEKRIASFLAKGEAVTNVDNCDERMLKKYLIEANKGKHFDYVFFGSSRCMTISTETTGQNLFNLGVSGATIQDFIALYQLCIDNDITFEHAVISIDPGLLNDKNADVRWKTLESSYNKFNGKNETTNKNIDLTKVKTLFSVSYFQSAYKGAIKSLISGNAIRNDLEIASTYENRLQTNFPDGTITYGEVYRDASQSSIDKKASNPLRQEFVSYDKLSQTYRKLFEGFLDNLHCETISFITFAYMEGYYNRLMQVPGIVEQTNYLNDLAKKKRYSNFGSYNPKEENALNTDFYDELHLRRQKIIVLTKEWNLFK